jgi:microcin C transport system permease protein
MGTYILKRLLLIIPTLFLILLINFIVIQIAPGGPVEQAIQQAETFQGMGSSTLAEMNDLKPNTQLRIGDVIKVPNL